MEGIDIPICRICMDGEQPSDLISPCDCRGSMSFVHRHCLDQWYAMRRNESCDTCYCKYAKKWCGMKPISEWWKLPPLSLYRLQLLVFFEQPLRAPRLFVVSVLTSLYYVIFLYDYEEDPLFGPQRRSLIPFDLIFILFGLMRSTTTIYLIMLLIFYIFLWIDSLMIYQWKNKWELRTKI